MPLLNEVLSKELLSANGLSIQFAVDTFAQNPKKLFETSLLLYFADGNQKEVFLQITIDSTDLNHQPGVYSSIIKINIARKKYEAPIAFRNIKGKYTTEFKHTSITFTSESATEAPFQGLGLGTALFQTSETLIRAAIRLFPEIFQDKHVYEEIADEAHSALKSTIFQDAEPRKFNRIGWTTRRIDGAGFIQKGDPRFFTKQIQ